MHHVIVKRANDSDINSIPPLVLESEREGFRFLRRFYEEFTTATNRFDRNGETLLIAQLSNEVVGICGLNRDPYIPNRNIGRVRRLYVHPAWRMHGIGKLLLSNIIDEAKLFYETLTLRTDNPIAYQFYKSIGFSTDHVYESATHYLSLT